MATDWDNLFKVRLTKADESLDKHDVIKTLLVRKILRTYRRKSWIRIYTEFKINGLVPDVYMENIRTKSVICYEIQKDLTKEWLEKKTKQYADHEIPFFTLDFIAIPLQECPDNISEINTWLEKYVV